MFLNAVSSQMENIALNKKSFSPLDTLGTELLFTKIKSFDTSL